MPPYRRNAAHDTVYRKCFDHAQSSVGESVIPGRGAIVDLKREPL